MLNQCTVQVETSIRSATGAPQHSRVFRMDIARGRLGAVSRWDPDTTANVQDSAEIHTTKVQVAPSG